MQETTEVVISGMAGRCPEAFDTDELWSKLLEGGDLISYDENVPENLGLPYYTGKAALTGYFDNTFFNIHNKLAERIDVNTCVTVETAFTAIMDAGVNPFDLGGKNIPVVVASGCTKFESIYSVDHAESGFSILGGSQCMLANRLSHALNLKGPSFNIDGSWSGFVRGMKYVKDQIMSGSVEAGIVGCANLGRLNEGSFHYQQMGRLCKDGKTSCFSENADGYVRSEGSIVCFLQKKQDAKRVYATIMTAEIKANFNKNVPIGDVYEATPVELLREIYEKNPEFKKQLSYIECSGEGLKCWDKAELNAIAEVVLKGREKPLLVGSIKSNLGHLEDASAGAALVKCIKIFEKGVIPPNIHYSPSAPNKGVPALLSGKLQVVMEPTKTDSDIIGMNTYNIDGSMSHVIIKRNPNAKKREPKVKVLPPDGLPRLFVASARNEQGIKHIIKTVQEMPIDEEFVGLSHKLFKNYIKQYFFRGYTLLNESATCLTEMKECDNRKLPIWLVFSGMGSQWTGMGANLMKIPIFAEAIYKCHKILKPKGLDLVNIITTNDESIFNNIMNSFVGIAAIQIGLVDILNAIGLVPDGIFGHSVGELGCAYADGCFTAEQMILAAYARGKASLDAKLIPGMMAAVGMGYNQIKDKLPEGIDVACHNSATSCTLSGPTKLMEEYIDSLKAEGVFARLVNASNIAYHSRYIQPAAPALLESLKKVVPSPKKRSSKWISSSVPENNWDTEAAMYCSAEYHTNNLLGSVLFEEASVHVPNNAIIIEVAPHGLLQAILKKSFPEAVHIPLTHRAQPDGVTFLLTALGKLFLEGLALDIDKLYPPIEFPVSRGTPSFEPFVFWNENVKVYTNAVVKTDNSWQVIVELDKEKYSHIKEFSINGEQFISPTFHLDLIIEHFQKQMSTDNPIVIENFTLLGKATIANDQCTLNLSYHPGLGDWELCQNSEGVSRGRIVETMKPLGSMEELSVKGITLLQDEIYNYISSIGAEVGQSARLVQSMTVSDEGASAKVLWNGNLSKFLDSILLLPLLSDIDNENELKIINKFQHLILDFKLLAAQQERVFKVSFDRRSGLLWCEGLELLYPQMKTINVPKKSLKEVSCDTLQFLPYTPPTTADIEELIEDSMQIIIQNLKPNKIPNMNLIIVLEGLDIHEKLIHDIKKRNGLKVDIMIVSQVDSIGNWGEEEYDCTLIVSGLKNHTETLLKLVKENYYFLLINQRPPNALDTIFEHTSTSTSFTLCKLHRDTFDIESDFVMISDPKWKEILERKLSNNKSSAVYVVGMYVSLTDVVNVIEECEGISNFSQIRFVFFDKVPVQFNPLKYKSQLDKDMRINIHQNGEWGTYRVQSTMFNTEYNKTDNKIFPFSNLRCPETKLNVIGVNLADVSATWNKIGLIEYVGEKDGVKICGLATLSEDSQTIEPDNHFLWIKPKSYRDEELASILLNYAMAYFILRVENNCLKGANIFVTEALHPLSQACISIALKDQLNVYTSYINEEEKSATRKLFPQIPEENFINLNYKQADILFLTKCQNVTFQILINTLPLLDHVNALIKLVGFCTKYYHTSLSNILYKEFIGMEVFVKHSSMIGLSPDKLMLLNDSQKNEIHRQLAAGLQSGEMKPVPTNTLTAEHLNVDAVSLLMNKASSHKKVIVNLETKNQPITSSPYFTASPDKGYLVIGDSRNFWIYICEWLIKRGAQNIYLVVKNNALFSSSKRFNNLVNMNPLLDLNLLSLGRTKDKQSIDATLQEINCSHSLAAAFVIGKENEDIAKCLCKSKDKFLLVSLCAGAGTECEIRAASGLPSVSICLPDALLQSHTVVPLLDPLLNQNKPIVYFSELKRGTQAKVHDLTVPEYLQGLPSTLEDLSQLINNVKTPSWKEVRTSGITAIHSREISPIFVLPTLKESYMQKFFQSLKNPAFKAVIPSDYNEIMDIAKQLAQGILKFQQNEVTLVCSDWAWSLGFAIAQFLEEKKKFVTIIALDSLAKRCSKATTCNYFKDLSVKLMSDKHENTSRGLSILENRLNFMYHSNLNNTVKLKGFFHIIKPDSAEDLNISQLQQYCEAPIKIHSITGTNYVSFLSEKNTVNIVNSLVLYEHKTANSNRQFKDKNIIEYCDSSAKSLERID